MPGAEVRTQYYGFACLCGVRDNYLQDGRRTLCPRVKRPNPDFDNVEDTRFQHTNLSSKPVIPQPPTSRFVVRAKTQKFVAQKNRRAFRKMKLKLDSFWKKLVTPALPGKSDQMKSGLQRNIVNIIIYIRCL